MENAARRDLRCARNLVLNALGLAALAAGGVACALSGGNGPGNGGVAAGDSERLERLRMVEEQIAARGIRDRSVLEAMRDVPRHRFVPESERRWAHSDGPLSIGLDQTISQPYIVALMTGLLRPNRAMKVLEIGTGSGYQAAVLAECVGEVYTVEILEPLSRRAEGLLGELGYRNVRFRVGDGFDGWPEAAPFDGIVVTAAPPDVPQPLLDQLRVGGRLVIPLGAGAQDLVVVTRTAAGFEREVVTGVRFVPMTGKAQRKP